MIIPKTETPKVFFGKVTNVKPDWRANPDGTMDDDADTPTPAGVIAMLGFDPALEEKVEEISN